VYLAKAATTLEAEELKYQWKIVRSYDEIRGFHVEFEHAIRRLGVSVDLPALPNQRSFRVSSIEQKLDSLTEYMGYLCQSPEIVLSQEFLTFIEVSILSFDGVGKKRKEGFLRKRTGGRVGNERRW
jgi:hypothetical protein